MRLLFQILLVSTFVLFSLAVIAPRRGYDPNKSTCTGAGHLKIDGCTFTTGIKSTWRNTYVYFWPETTLNMTLDELKVPCDEHFVCIENTGCVQDFYNYAELDQCIDSIFNVGPYYFCDKKLREVLNNNSAMLSNCTKQHLEQRDPESNICENIEATGECFLPDVQKHCSEHVYQLYKEHLALRLFNRACDGRLRYKDLKNNSSVKILPNGSIVVQDE